MKWKLISIFIIVGVCLISLISPEDSYSIFFEGFEGDWERVTGTVCDGSPSITNIGDFNNADSNGGDFIWCVTTGGPGAYTGSYSMLAEDWDGGALTDTKGIWFNFDASVACGGSGCDYINVDFWGQDSGLDVNEYCWLTEQYEGGVPIALGTISSSTNSWTNFNTNLSEGALSSGDVNIRIMCDMSTTGDEGFYDDINVTGYLEAVEEPNTSPEHFNLMNGRFQLNQGRFILR